MPSFSIALRLRSNKEFIYLKIVNTEPNFPSFGPQIGTQNPVHITEALEQQSSQENVSDHQMGAKLGALGLPTISQAERDSVFDAGMWQ